LTSLVDDLGDVAFALLAVPGGRETFQRMRYETMSRDGATSRLTTASSGLK